MVFKKLIKKVGPVFGHQQMLLKQDKEFHNLYLGKDHIFCVNIKQLHP
jgi:hypothetical protein